MKQKVFINYCILCFVFLFIGCQKDMVSITMPVDLEQIGRNSKVYINERYFICWNGAGDAVNVNGTEGVVQYNGRQWELAFQGESMSTYTAAYPYAQSVVDGTAGSIDFSFQSVSSIEYDESFDYENVQKIDMPMVAYCSQEQSSLTFRNAAALMGFKVVNEYSDPIKVKKISLRSDKSYLWGNAIVEGVTSENPKIVYQTSNDNLDHREKILTMGSGVDISRGDSNIFYMVVPESEGDIYTVRIEVVKGGQTFVFEKSTNNTTITHVQRNDYVLLPVNINDNNIFEGDLAGFGTQDKPYIISSEAQLGILKDKLETNSGYTNGLSSTQGYQPYKTAYFKQLSNFNFKGGVGFGNAFCGHYDGNGKTITLTGNGGVFNQLGAGAEVKNLIVKTGFDSRNRPYWVSGDILGGIVDIIVGSDVDIISCISECNLSGPFYSVVGGICGKIGNNSVKIESCKFLGKISTFGTCGGICGKYEGVENEKLTFFKCSNGDNVSLFGQEYRGNLLGYASGNSSNVIVKTSDTDTDTTPGPGDVGNFPQE